MAYIVLCSCIANVYKLGAYAVAGLILGASRVPCPCGLPVVYEITPPLNLASLDIACTESNLQTNNKTIDTARVLMASIYILNNCLNNCQNVYLQYVFIPHVFSRTK